MKRSSIIHGRLLFLLSVFVLSFTFSLTIFQPALSQLGRVKSKPTGFWKCCAFPSDLGFSGLTETRVTAAAGAAQESRCFFETDALWVKKLDPDFRQHEAEKRKQPGKVKDD